MKKLITAIVVGMLAFAQPAHAEGNKLIHGLIFSNMLLNAVDTSESMYLVGRHPETFHEGNLLLRPFQDQPVKFALAKNGFNVGTNLLILENHEKLGTKKAIAVLVVMNVASGYVCYKNAKTGNLR